MLPKKVRRTLTVGCLFITGAEEFFKLRFHGVSEGEGVKSEELGHELFFGGLGNLRGIDDSLKRGFWGIVTFDGF
jgi:hypothetical protein